MNLFDIKVKNLKHEETTLAEYKGKVILIVNTATKCGHTKQYDGLQKLYTSYEDKGFVILDFPCNQFLAQAPGDVEEIKAFCDLNFNTTFPMFDKIKVNGFFTHPLYRYLKSNAPFELQPNQSLDDAKTLKKTPKRIKWNFTKFLIDQNGEIKFRFSPGFQPDQIEPFIKSLLNT